MSLREEITNHIKILTPNPTDGFIDEILSIFEKRIDELLKHEQDNLKQLDRYTYVSNWENRERDRKANEYASKIVAYKTVKEMLK